MSASTVTAPRRTFGTGRNVVGNIGYALWRTPYKITFGGRLSDDADDDGAHREIARRYLLYRSTMRDLDDYDMMSLRPEESVDSSVVHRLLHLGYLMIFV